MLLTLVPARHSGVVDDCFAVSAFRFVDPACKLSSVLCVAVCRVEPRSMLAIEQHVATYMLGNLDDEQKQGGWLASLGNQRNSTRAKCSPIVKIFQAAERHNLTLRVTAQVWLGKQQVALAAPKWARVS